MVGIRILFSWRIAFPLYSPYMKQYRAFQLLGVAHQASEPSHIMPVHRSQVNEPHILEHTAGEQGLLYRRFDFMGHTVDLGTAWQHRHHFSVSLFELKILWLEPLMC